MRVRNISDGIVTISKKNIASSRDAALLTRDASMQPGDELVIYDFIAEGLVSLSDLITRGLLQVVNDDQPVAPPASVGAAGPLVTNVSGVSIINIPITAGKIYRLDYRLVHAGSGDYMSARFNGDASALYDWASNGSFDGNNQDGNSGDHDVQIYLDNQAGSRANYASTGSAIITSPLTGANGATIIGNFWDGRGFGISNGPGITNTGGNWRGTAPATMLNLLSSVNVGADGSHLTGIVALTEVA